jgi:hypothetical protein
MIARADGGTHLKMNAATLKQAKFIVECTAYHEASHLLIAGMVRSDVLERITIEGGSPPFLPSGATCAESCGP